MGAHEPYPEGIAESVEALERGAMSAAELVRSLLERIDSWDPAIGAYQTVFVDQAFAAAQRADMVRRTGDVHNPLTGIPIAVKDVLTTAEGPTLAGSRLSHPFRDNFTDAKSVAALRAAGAVILGKTRTSEFAIGVPDPEKGLVEPLNPRDPQAWVGGSSSGSAAAVAARLACGALGSDTGGSIRIPSACCGITGLKPTYGLVSADGCVPLRYTSDTVGPMGLSACDCRLLLDGLLGPSTKGPRHDQSVGRYRLGVDTLEAHAGLRDPAQAPAFHAAVMTLVDCGADVDEVALPYFDEVSCAAQVILLAEGVSFHESRLRESFEGFGTSTRQRLGIGLLLSGADYVQAQRVRKVGLTALQSVFQRVDYILTPTSHRAAPSLAETSHSSHAPITGLHVRYWNGVGLPTVSIPIGISSTGRPLAMQISGRPFDDFGVLAVAEEFQSRTDWHKISPSLAIDTAPGALRKDGSIPSYKEPNLNLSPYRQDLGTRVAPEDYDAIRDTFERMKPALEQMRRLAQGHTESPPVDWTPLFT